MGYIGTTSCPQVFYSERGIHWHHKLPSSILLRTWDTLAYKLPSSILLRTLDTLALQVVPKYFTPNVGYIGTISCPQVFYSGGIHWHYKLSPSILLRWDTLAYKLPSSILLRTLDTLALQVVPKYFTPNIGYVGTIRCPQVFYSDGIHWHYKLSPSILLRWDTLAL